MRFKNRIYPLLLRKIRKVVQPVLTEAWVSQVSSYNESTRTINVTWTLNVSKASTMETFYNIYHSKTPDGVVTNYTWGMPANKTTVGGTYSYPVDGLGSITELVYGIYSSTKYALPDTQQRPKEIKLQVNSFYQAPTPLLFNEDMEDSNISNMYGIEANSYSFTSNAYFRGNLSLKLNLKPTDPEIHGGTRAEINPYSVAPERDMWYSFAALFPPDYNNEVSKESICQWHSFPDTNLGENWRSPATMMYVSNGRLYLSIDYNELASSNLNDTPNRVHLDLGLLPKNQWVEFVFHIKHSHLSDGIVELWMNGTKKVTHLGGNSWNDAQLPYWKLGIYKWDWNGTATTTVPHREVYLDNIKIGGSTQSLATMTTPPGTDKILSIFVPTTPAAPTNGVSNDNEDTFSFTKNPSYAISDHEFTINNGATWTPCSSQTIAIGDKDIPPGHVKVRVKALNGDNAGNTLSSTSAFTKKIVGSCPVWNSSYNNPWPTNWQAPINITQGGTYTGNFQTTNSYVPCVNIATTQPVILLNCNFKGPGWAVSDSNDGSNITILNSRHFGEYGQRQPRFIDGIGNLKNLVVENCDLYDSCGIKLAEGYSGDYTPNNTIKIRYNRAFNISGWHGGSDPKVGNFVQTDKLYHLTKTYGTRNGKPLHEGVPYAEISWNEVINRPGLSHAEDNINLHNSRGCSWSPWKVHHNLIYGAWRKDWRDGTFSGSGMICEGSNPDGKCAAYVDFEDNVVIASNNNTYGFAGGNNCNMRRNVGLSKGFIDDEDATRMGIKIDNNDFSYPGGSWALREFKGYSSDFYILDYYNNGGTYDNLCENHISGVVGPNSYSNIYGRHYWRNDKPTVEPHLGRIVNQTWLPDRITRETEDFYINKMRQLRKDNCITIGVIG
jgi:hypothetical protein